MPLLQVLFQVLLLLAWNRFYTFFFVSTVNSDLVNTSWKTIRNFHQVENTNQKTVFDLWITYTCLKKSESKNQKWFKRISILKTKYFPKDLVFCAMFNEELLLYCNDFFMSWVFSCFSKYLWNFVFLIDENYEEYYGNTVLVSNCNDI